MARAQSWKDVRLGAAVLVLTVAVGAAILTFARVGALHGDTVRLYAATPHARGILPGSEVWLAGQKVGVVADVSFQPPSADTARRVLLALDVLARYHHGVRRDAPVSIRAGGNLIGAPVVAITPLTSSAPRVDEGDTLVARVSEFESARAQLTTAVGTEVPVLLDNVRVLGAQLRTARGTLGALGIEGPGRITATATAAGRLLDRTLRGGGTVSLALGGNSVAQARAALARAAGLREALSSPRTAVGRARADSALVRAVADVRVELARVQALLDEPRGTAGRAGRDEALRDQVVRARTELDLLVADVKRNPLRYVNP